MADKHIVIGSVPSWQGEYDPSRSYMLDNVVAHSGNAYISLTDDNDAPPTDSERWAVFVQGLNGILAEAACGKQTLAATLRRQGATLPDNPTYNEMAEAAGGLFLPSQTDFWRAFGYEGEDDNILQQFSEGMQIMLDAWDEVLAGTRSLLDWKNAWPWGYDKLPFVPKIDATPLTDLKGLFAGCKSLAFIPAIQLGENVSLQNTFGNCAIKVFPAWDTSRVTVFADLCYGCWQLHTVPYMDVGASLLDLNQTVFRDCFVLETCNLCNLKKSLQILQSPLLTAESVAYIVAHSAATSAITITLHATAYERAIADEQVQAALAEHPLVTLASA